MNLAHITIRRISGGSGFICCLLLSILSNRAAETYQNPVVPGDFPDPSVIRVGKEYWATTTSSEWGPQFPLLKSADLVNWELAGSVFAHRPSWASANFWAPEISEYQGRCFVYYVGRKINGPLAVGVAIAPKPGGPYVDHGPLVAQPAGSIDPVPVTDENGRRYLVWKEDGNSRRQPTVLWAQPLAETGDRLVDEPRELFRNDAPWEGAVVEGPFVVRRDGWFYLFYSGNACCGRACDYALGVARSRALLGPWEKNPANPILAGNAAWKCPGHGSIVQDANSRYWLLYHAYSATNSIYTGREALLDEVKFETSGWPTINQGRGPSSRAQSPARGSAPPPLEFKDDFTGPSLAPGWQWPQENEPRFRTARPDGLTLAAQPAFATNLLGAVLARSTWNADYICSTELTSLAPASAAGIAVIGDPANALALLAGNGKLTLWRIHQGRPQKVIETDLSKTTPLHLRASATQARTFRFETAADGKNWRAIGDPQPGDNLPPWDRGMRVGLVVGGAPGAEATFKSFHIQAAAGPAH